MTAIVLAVSLVLAAPSILAAVRGTGEVDTALLHLVLALVVTAVAAQVLRRVVRPYQEQAAHPVGEADDDPAGPGTAGGRRRTDF